MKVVEIRREAELQELKPAWDGLLRDSASASTFLSWEWATAWWLSYGTPGNLRILKAVDENGEIRGIAPLRSETVRRYGRNIPALSFVGDGSNDSDYLDFVIAAGSEEPVLEAFGRHWAQDLDRGSILSLNGIPATSTSLVCLQKQAKERGSVWMETDVPGCAAHLPQSWDEYVNKLRPRFRTKVRSALRNLEGRPEVRFGFCDGVEQIERLLPALFDLHTRRWVQHGKPGVFGENEKRQFYAALSPLLLQRNWLRLSWLEWNGKILACQYGFVYGDRYFQLQEGYEPLAEHWNAGIGLRAWSIREFLRQGIREYDYLSGSEQHKIDWGAEAKQSKRILIARPTLQNLLVARGPEWEEQAKEVVKKLVPERVLAVRRARLEQQQRLNGNAPEASGKEWMRKAVSEFYFHSRLPALIRPLRDRYQLSGSTNGSGKVLSWNRRTEATARILCFHRVNEDADPFFPAISTHLFERQMRYLARHYKVIKVSEVLDHMRGGSPQPVLALTFDDGYQDNYQHAFPILERYGLPATIFLSTESIDSRLPLWFEELAEALKRTEREFVDLDSDIPRRFRLRTTEQRLEANDRLFRLLRELPDGIRRQTLEDILRQLADGKRGERNDKMLTWDQIRLMTSKGIDFGSHTVTHPFISKLTREQAAWEVTESKSRIEKELQCSVNSFAYPHGREADFGECDKTLLRSAGYRAAVTTIWGVNDHSTDPMELRRGGPWEETVAQFAGKLEWYQWVNG